MTTTERATAPTARLPRRSRRGLIMNLSAPQAITLLAAVLLVAVCDPGVRRRRRVLGRAAGRRPAGGGRVGPTRDGFPVSSGRPSCGISGAAMDPSVRVPGHRRPRAAGKLALPGEEARLLTLTAPDGSVVVHDPWTGGYTAIMRVRAPAFLLLDPETQDAQVSGWGRVQAGLCQSNLISRAQVLELCVPDSGDGLRDYYAAHARGQELSAWATENYRDLMDVAGPASSRSES